MALTMLRCGGWLTHAASATWWLTGLAFQSEPMGWLYAGMHAVYPAAVSASVAVLMTLAGGLMAEDSPL